MDEILKFIISKNEGVTDNQIYNEYPTISKRDVTKILNTLLKSKQIDIHNRGQTLIYKKTSSAIDEERVIYNLILEAQGKGLWLRDIKLKSNIPQNLITKILQQMVNKKIIKSVKSVKTNRKVYVLYNEDPDEEVTGGVWFNDGDLDEEFVNEMIKLIYKFLISRNNNVNDYRSYPSLEDIFRFVEMSKISSVSLNSDDIETLLKVMVYDELIQELVTDTGILYMPLKQS